eukprot:scaffold393999_cov18-Prasinocladus_malaysianus.AAC.1
MLEGMAPVRADREQYVDHGKERSRAISTLVGFSCRITAKIKGSIDDCSSLKFGDFERLSCSILYRQVPKIAFRHVINSCVMFGLAKAPDTLTCPLPRFLMVGHKTASAAD